MRCASLCLPDTNSILVKSLKSCTTCPLGSPWLITDWSPGRKDWYILIIESVSVSITLQSIKHPLDYQWLQRLVIHMELAPGDKGANRSIRGTDGSGGGNDGSNRGLWAVLEPITARKTLLVTLSTPAFSKTEQLIISIFEWSSSNQAEDIWFYINKTLKLLTVYFWPRNVSSTMSNKP